jgi:hypothetical protein
MGDSGNASDYGSRVKIGAQATLAGVSGFEAGFGGADASSPSDLASSLDELLNSLSSWSTSAAARGNQFDYDGERGVSILYRSVSDYCAMELWMD